MGGMGGNNVRLRSGKSGVKMYDLDASTAVGGGGGKMTPNNVSQYLRKRRAKRVYGSLYHHRFARARCCNKILESCFPGTISVNKRAFAV